MIRRKLLTLAGLAALGLPAPAAHAAEIKAALQPEDPAIAMVTSPVLFDQLFATFPESIRTVDPGLVKVVVFRETRQDRFPELNALIESRITDELIRTNRFRVVECRECRTPRVVSDDKSFSYSNTIESNARMAEIGHQLGVDGVLMWHTMGTGKNVIVNFKLVRAMDGAIVWSKSFQTEPYRDLAAERRQKADEERRYGDSGLYISGAFQGFSASRASTTGGAAETADGSLGLNLALLRQSSFLDNLAFGVEAGYSALGAPIKPDVSVQLLNVNAAFLLSLDPLFFKETKNRVVNLYGGLGQGFMIADNDLRNAMLAKGGLMLRFTPESFLNIGFVNLPQQRALRQRTVNGLEGTTDVGGFTYEIGAGFILK
ncbi:MAG: hypothetical protein VKO21_00345 [Candidatus Sericytochromatia bacterium]|nr:hypothetical protein [Candidatus Sericytochromatia bacterium]